jgi:hypothetical protein
MATVITNTDIGAFLGISGSPQKLNAIEQLRGNNYIVVYGKSQTVEQNGIELVSKYNLAKIATPFSQPLSDTNRFTVFVAPGVYVLDFVDINLDTPYIDIISLSGETDVVISSNVSNVPFLVDTSDIRLRGFNLGSQAIKINSAYSNNYFENIIGGDYNFSHPSTSGDVAGNFKNCVGGLYSFGDADSGQILAASTLENCAAEDWSFGYTLSSCDLKNCTAGFSSFGYHDLLGCNLTDCKSNSGDSFGTNNSINSSTLTNCSATSYSFGRTNGTSQILNSTFIDCTAEEGSFGTVIEGCTFRNCKAAENSFGKTSDIGTLSEINSTTFTDCKAGDYSFGVRIVATDVVFTNCTAGIESFGADQANGTYKNCRAGINSFGAGTQGWSNLIAGGQFFNCVADENSFGTEYANGAFYYCVCNGLGGWVGNTQSGMGGYAAYCKGMNPTGPGTAIYCTDATNNPVNYGLGSTTNNI